MIRIYRTINGKVTQIDDYKKDCWIRMTNPTDEEIKTVADRFNIEEDYIRAALDREEISRVEGGIDESSALIAVNVPCKAPEENQGQSWRSKINRFFKKIRNWNKPKYNSEVEYETVPLGIIDTKFCVVTVCLEEIPELQDLVDGKVKHVFTNLHSRFIFQILYYLTQSYIFYLKKINKTSDEIDYSLRGRSPNNDQLYEMLNLEKSTVYFSTALKSNQAVIEKVSKGRIVASFERDRELLEDIEIEIDQAINMCSIYGNILSSTMNTMASIISNNQNRVMKTLTFMTIVFTVPTVISSAYGMNLPGIPLQPDFFGVCFYSLIITLVFAIVVYLYNLFVG